MRRFFSMFRMIVMAVVLGSAVGIASSVAAQDTPDDDTIALGIQKYNCPTAAAFDAGSANCELGGGVTFEVATVDGEVLGTCTTEIGVVRTSEVAYCYVMGLPFDTELVITEDLSTGPAGYVPLENPKVMTIERPAPDAADFTPTAVFVNVLADADTDEGNGDETATDGEGEAGEAVTLPNTGSGTAADGMPGNLFLGTAMLLLSGTSLLVRRQLFRS